VRRRWETVRAIPDEQEESSMITITLHCPHCGSDALVRDGMPSKGNRRIAVMPVGVAAARILPPMPIPKLAARRSCMPLKNASLLRGLTRTFGVSRATVSSWITKKELSFLPCLQPY